MVEIIKKKRDGLELSKEEIQEVINGLVNGQIPDYQVSALLMAIYFQNMSEQETVHLTEAVLRSGEQIDLSNINGIKVDKHSTGGVGDKTTLILAPLIASAGVPVAKMSGRGLGHTGGTIDKLESIRGFSADLSTIEFIEKVKKHQIAICGQNEILVPADKKLYALRDVTATVDNLALITSSIMSKKLVCGADAIVIDMKVGTGAFMKDLERAEKLGRTMINIGQRMNRKIVIVLSAMDQPLGNAIGNAIEVREAVATLKGQGPDDLTELCLGLGANMLLLAGKSKSIAEGKTQLKELLNNGTAFNKFRELIHSQGGDLTQIEDTSLLPTSKFHKEYRGNASGYISHLDALEIGQASVLLGAGRENKSSIIDMGAGIILRKKIGDYAEAGEVLADLYTDDMMNLKKVKTHLNFAYKFSEHPPVQSAIIYKTII